MAVPALLAVGAMASVMAQGALAASFAASGSHFQVGSSELSSKGLASHVDVARSADGGGHPVSLLALDSAKLADICQSAQVKTPLGPVTFRLRAGGDAGPVTAGKLFIDAESLDGDARFGTAEIGRDASRLTQVPGVRGPRGAFGLQAGEVSVRDVRSQAWSATGGDFRLKGLKLDVALDGERCF
ncbi:cholesterol esterase [Streptomyces sp. HNM0574]|nr:cholesterol esterase [Streptomyces sp. HNM0574]